MLPLLTPGSGGGESPVDSGGSGGGEFWTTGFEFNGVFDDEKKQAIESELTQQGEEALIEPFKGGTAVAMEIAGALDFAVSVAVQRMRPLIGGLITNELVKVWFVNRNDIALGDAGEARILRSFNLTRTVQAMLQQGEDT